MKVEGDGQLLRIFIGESDHWHNQPLHEAIVLKARQAGIAGATVIRGFLGYGANSHIHTTEILRLSADLPIIVEIVDKAEKIAQILPELDAMIGEGMITLEKVNVIAYRSKEKSD
jgi:PII-like signaling protein